MVGGIAIGNLRCLRTLADMRPYSGPISPLAVICLIGISHTESDFFFFLVCVQVKCVTLTFYQHRSCTPAHVVATLADAVTSALAQVFGKRGVLELSAFRLVHVNLALSLS